MRDCPFCNIGDRILKENEGAVLFLSNPRKVPGHFLVSPKRHVEKPWEISEDELKAIFELVYFVQRRIVGTLAKGCDVRQNYRPFMQQSRYKVDHVHYHILPRDFQDNLYDQVEKFETPMFEDLSDEEHDRIAKILK